MKCRLGRVPARLDLAGDNFGNLSLLRHQRRPAAMQITGETHGLQGRRRVRNSVSQRGILLDVRRSQALAG